MAVHFRMTLELYQELLTRLNFTLESVAGGGVSPALLAAAEEYKRTLEDLLARVLNATIMLVLLLLSFVVVYLLLLLNCLLSIVVVLFVVVVYLLLLFNCLLLLCCLLFSREEALTSEHSSFEMNTLSLQDTVNELISNLMNAESSFLGLQGRLEGAESTYNMLRVGVATLERSIQLELRQLLEEAMSLRRDLETQVGGGARRDCISPGGWYRGPGRLV